ncbi:tetraspanin-33-like [Rhipicephalus microplus]
MQYNAAGYNNYDDYDNSGQTAYNVRYPLLLLNLFLWFVGTMLICVSSFLYVTAGNTADDTALFKRLDLMGVLIRRLETVVFLAGMSLFIVSFCGCVGALRENSFLLKLYSLALTVLIVINMLLGIVVLFMPGSVKKVIKDSLSESLVIHYRDTMDTENVVDALQRQLRCCGMTTKSFRDWNKNIYFNCSLMNPSHERCSVPYSCCKPTNLESVSLNCGRNVLNMSDYDAWFIVNIGNCPDALHRYVKEHVMIIGGCCLIAVILLAFVDMITNAVIDEIDIICKIYQRVEAAEQNHS